MRVYFYCRDNPAAYQDDVVVLADGLRQIGVEVFAHCRTWRPHPDREEWLLEPDPRIGPDDCDIVVVNTAWVRWLDTDFRISESALPKNLFHPGRRYRTACLDLDDGYATSTFRPEFRAFDAVFRAKYNRRCYHPRNHRPWVLGLSSRMIECTSDAPAWDERSRDVLVNFNASHPYVHGARAEAAPPFVEAARRYFGIDDRKDDLRIAPSDPYDRLMWEQTQHRHSRSYYERLKHAQAVAAFCGELIPPAPFRPRYLAGGRRAQLSRAFYRAAALVDPRPPRLIQWDSWRFWESLAAGCLTFNLDLQYYGVELPVPAKHLVHYVAVTPHNAAQVLSELHADPSLPARIAQQGRAWALENYSPPALARRFLDTIMGTANAHE